MPLKKPLGEAMFTIIGAMAQLERDITRERVKAGVARAYAASGLDDPKRSSTETRFEQLRAEGLSFRQIGKQLGISPVLALQVHRSNGNGSAFRNPQENYPPENATVKASPGA